jgi:hypothetical protein
LLSKRDSVFSPKNKGPFIKKWSPVGELPLNLRHDHEKTVRVRVITGSPII